jgi:hypothetical protein
LLLLNSDFSLSAARDLSKYVRTHAGDDPDAQIALAYRRALGHAPTTSQQARAQKFLSAGETETPDPLTLLCLAIFNSNEFIYVD